MRWLLVLLLTIACQIVQAAQLPRFEQVKQQWQSSYARLLDRHGHVLSYQRLNKQQHRFEWTALDDVSPALIDALLFVEDRDFYQHHGVDWGAVSRSAISYLTGQKARGASTISMQLVALLDNTLSWQSGGRTVSKKWQQIWAAKQLERQWTKAQILEAYLNLVIWRGDLQGVSVASLALFDKWPRGLDRDESLVLVALLAAPNANYARLKQRVCQLAQAGFTADCTRMRLLVETQLHRRQLPFAMQPDIDSLAARLLSEAHQDLRTSLDASLQQFAYQTLVSQLRSLVHQQANAGAVLVIHNATGEVLAYVANSGLDQESQWVDGVQALRQAGSTLKPFLYTLAIDQQRLTAASVLDDKPVNISTELGLYVPQNYEKDFKGAVTVRTALASSLNVPAVLTLQQVGLTSFWQLLKDLGFSLEQQPDYYGNALALGGSDVSLWQLANAYRTLANAGQRNPLFLTLPHDTPVPTAPLWSSGSSFIVSDILSDRQARSLSFGFENPLATPFWTAVKTGTSKDMRDNWCIGFSQTYTVAVWVGNMQGLPMRDVSGITGAAPIWFDIMHYLHQDQMAMPAPVAPATLQQMQVQFTGFNQPSYLEWFLEGTGQQQISYQADTIPQIIYPAHGTIIALDPDMPVARQKVFFKAHVGGEHLAFWLNDQYLAQAEQDYAWQPQRGHYHLQLKTHSGQTRADIRFEVRGKVVKP
ncbi:penicillin-binding protein 1C [Agitococcus lubricus]|uniref:peptidoglycan glycosyltransferase n=1 Tax=Agitococcus lubricus TaxID=1077255 RepID=A0A2T5J183_9GAMM|nr:penicillin-binding protein 1C [Agitococcus lubricus]PTQ90157.1 penicillin-binding protein 1C [Agitococcus lubricus]